MDHGSGQVVGQLQAGPFHVSRMVHRSGLRLESHEHVNACLHFVTRGCYAEATRAGTIRVGRRHLLLMSMQRSFTDGIARPGRELRSIM